jgi:inorganic triphosphatase YgiF
VRLERGTPRDLHDVANEWRMQFPVRIGATADFEHGQVLLDQTGEPLKVMKSVAFMPEMPADASFAAMGRAGLRHFRLSEERLRLSAARVDLIQLAAAVRHLHVALALFEDMLKGADLDRFRFEFGWLSRELSEVLTADLIASRTGPAMALGEGDRIGKEAVARLGTLFDSHRYRCLPLDFAEWVAIGDWRTSNTAAEYRQRMFAEFATAGLIRIRKRLKDWARHRQRLDLAERQQTLSASKRLRQVAEIIVKPGQTRRADLFSNALDDFEAELGELSETASVHAALNELAMIEGRHILSARSDESGATGENRRG